MPLLFWIVCSFVGIAIIDGFILHFSTTSDPDDNKVQGEDETDYISDKLDKYSSWKRNIQK
jgi:hypothetical protein